MTKYVEEGNKINTDILDDRIAATDDERIEVFKNFEKLGVAYLKPIFEELKEEVSYDDLRILKVCYLNLLNK